LYSTLWQQDIPFFWRKAFNREAKFSTRGWNVLYRTFTTDTRKKILFESIFNFTTDGIVVVDLEGRVLEVNKKFEQLHGWTKNEVTGKVLPMIPEHYKDNALQLFRRIMDGEQHTGIEFLNLRKDGSTFYTSVTISPVLGELGNIIAFIAVERDITEKKKVEQALKESEERYRILVECSPEPIVVFTNYRVAFANPATAELIGAESTESLVDKHIYQYVHPDHLEDLDVEIKWILSAGRSSELFEKKLIRLDGKEIYVEVKAVPVMFRGALSVQLLFRDITDRKKAETELIESEKQHRRILKLSPQPIVLHRDGTIQFVNDMGVHMFGADSLDDLVGLSIFDLFCPSCHPLIMERMKKVVQTDEYLDFTEMKVKRLDGGILEVEVSSIYIHKYLDLPFVQLVLRDITERKKTEELIVRSEKLSVIGQLAAGIAHEIRNPLTSLKGFAQLLRAKNAPYVDIMLEEMQRIEYIVNDFMTLAKPQAVQFKRCDIQEVVNGVLLFMQPQALLNNAQFDLQTGDRELLVLCDSNQIKQVLMNLLKNAMESMPNGGTIEIEVKEHTNQHILIQIIDHGVGIEEDKLSKLGEPFFSTKESGTGLGIMICQRIIETHNGKLTIKSKVGCGTIVEIELPKYEPKSAWQPVNRVGSRL
jgi:two-component system sporulation sensor kinase A